jgi:uncharacterized protein YprB with RNaseH-like and TPR domain
MHIMIDIETLGTAADAPIVALGAVSLSDLDGEGFYQEVSPEGRADFDTIAWWLGQAMENPDAAKRVVRAIGEGEDLEVGLYNLMAFVRRVIAIECGHKSIKESDVEVNIWSNGASFDIPIIEQAAKRRGVKLAWSYRDHRCYRTLKELVDPSYELVPSGEFTAHSALDDARFQAKHLSDILAVAPWPTNTAQGDNT